MATGGTSRGSGPRPAGQRVIGVGAPAAGRVPAGPASTLPSILKLEVPIVVQLGERMLGLGEVMSLMPGAIIELPKNAESELELLVHNKAIGTGAAVKVGENFGIQINYIGDIRERIKAMARPVATPSDGEDDAAAGSLDASIQAILGGR